MKCLFKSAEYLIQELKRYPNWNNNTCFTAYISLLSFYNESELLEECRPFYKGNATKDNLKRECDFLRSADPDETIVFYYDGHNAEANLGLDRVVVGTELEEWLPKGCIVVLDTCDAEWWIDILGSGRTVLASCEKYQSSYGWEYYGWFTGNKEVQFRNGSRLPLGIIGSQEAAQDSNNDGWISWSESFEFASVSTQQFVASYNETMNPVIYNDLGFDPPFVLRGWVHPPIANFTYTTAFEGKPVIFNASTSNGTIVYYQWDFGDGNITKTTKPIITHIYSVGNYTVRLEVIDSQGLFHHVVETDIKIRMIGDLNGDYKVNIVDIVIVARALGSRPGDPRWNPDCDLNNDELINFDDLEKVAEHFGKRL
jgi:hypothetical protein